MAPTSVDTRHPAAIRLDTVAKGAAEALFQHNLAKVVENIRDPNTNPRKPRKIRLTLTIQPNEKRNEATITIDASCTLIPSKPADSHLFIGEHLGVAQAVEHNPDQLGLFKDRPKPQPIAAAVNFTPSSSEDAGPEASRD